MGKRGIEQFIKRILYLSICLGSLFLAWQVNAGEIKPMMPPQMEGKTRDCLECHRYPNVETNAGAFASQSFCLECHEKATCVKIVDKTKVSLKVDPEKIRQGRHAFVGCIQCHTDVARSPHQSKNGAQCLNCHPFHTGAGEIHAPHLRVQCQACHGVSKFVNFDKNTDQVRPAHINGKKMPIGLTDHNLQDTRRPDFCKRCHTPKNAVGAADAVLPSKSFICIMCHDGSLTMGGPLFWVALILFVLGLLFTVHFWFQGSVQGEEKSMHRKIGLVSESIWGTFFSRDFFTILKTILLDVILQRRLLQESVKRWFIHSLIFLPILFRFLLSIFTFFVSRIGPESSLAVILIDKNSGFTAFVNDLSGILILLGIVLAALQRFIIKPPHVVSEAKDNVALLLIGLLVVLGFLTEGVRILMTQLPPEVGFYSFIGYPISRLLSPLSAHCGALYPYLWWAHAVVGAIFVAYLPFGKMRHMFNTPLTLLLNYKMK
jgi:nitrate reductase gamma subunit